MALTSVVRVSRKDTKSKKDFVLIHTTQEDPHLFKLVLEATEGENAYSKTISRHDLKKLRARAFQGTTEELEAALSWVLLRQDPPAGTEDVALSTEAVAAVSAEQNITLTLRRRTEGITPELCTVTLPSTDAEIQLYDWTGDLAAQLTESSKLRRELEFNAQKRDADLEKLRAQLDGLIEAKKAHENELLEKCRQLLNAKKLKIRDQQRLLAGAKIDPSLANKVKSSRSTSKQPKAAAATRASKRKAPAVKEESDSDEAFEEAAAKEEDVPMNGGDEQLETPQDSEAEDTDEEMADRQAQQQSSSARETNKKAADELPPPRALPFNPKSDQKEQAQAPSQRVKEESGEETEEEEL